MSNKEAIKLFEDRMVRTVWSEEDEKWYFSIIDIVEILTDSKDYKTARKYRNKLKQRLKEDGNETVTNCYQLKLRSADTEQLFQLMYVRNKRITILVLAKIEQ